MRIIGMISGTSFDGIDVAAVELVLSGRALELAVLGHAVIPYQEELRQQIRSVLPPHNTTVDMITRLDTAIGQAFGEVATRAMDEYCEGFANLVVSHGQTVFHWREHDRAQGSLQLGEPAWIAESCGVPVVSGLRTRDIAAGGEGAPLVSMFDVLLLRQHARAMVALNLGGIANLTAIRPGKSALAYDTGPGNALIDAASDYFSYGARRQDSGGAIAAAGKVNQSLLNRLLDDAFLRQQPPKSTGKEHYNLEYLLDALKSIGDVEPADVVATVTDLTIRTVSIECLSHAPTEVVASGGGLNNKTIMRGLAETLHPVPVHPIDVMGIPAKAKEAIAFAVLGYLTFHGLPATIPSCTGARRATLLGCITPGRGPLRLPVPAHTAPGHLKIVSDTSASVSPPRLSSPKGP